MDFSLFSRLFRWAASHHFLGPVSAQKNDMIDEYGHAEDDGRHPAVRHCRTHAKCELNWERVGMPPLSEFVWYYNYRWTKAAYHLVYRQLRNTVPVTGTETRRVIYAHAPRIDLWTFLLLITVTIKLQSHFRGLKSSLLRLDRRSTPVISAEWSFTECDVEKRLA